MKLKIGFVCDTIQGPLGGGVISARQVVDRLRQDHEVLVVAADAYGEPRLTQPGFQLPLRAMREMRFVMAKPDRKQLDRAIAEVDVVHLQLPFWLSFAALSAARKASRPVVAAFHVQPENALANLGVSSPLLCRVGYHAWVHHFYNRTNVVVCPSRFAEKKLRDHGLSVPACVISNGVAADLEAEPTAARPAAREKFVVMTIGRFAAEKRQDLVIQAVARSRFASRIHLVVAGGGPNEGELRRLLSDLPGSYEIGYFPRERLIELLHGADLLVHASEVELEGMAVLEAMHAGLPALIADGPETASAELALDETFRFRAGDLSDLTTRLDALLAAPEELERARVRSREATRRFTVNAGVEELVHLYHDVM